MSPQRRNPTGRVGSDGLAGRVGRGRSTNLRGCVDCNATATPVTVLADVVVLSVAHDPSCPAWKSGGPIGRPDAMPKPDLELRWPR